MKRDNDLALLLKAASEAEAQRDFSRAEQYYAQALLKLPTHRELRLRHCITIALQGKSTIAIERFSRYLATEPDSKIALNWLSVLLRQEGRGNEAMRYSAKAVENHPSDLESLYNYGLACFRARFHEQAIHWLEKAVAIDKAFAAGLYALACVYEAIGQPWQALIAIRKNVAIDKQPEGFLKLAKICLSVEKRDEAIEMATAALDNSSTRAEAHLVLAQANADSDEAKEQYHLKEAIRLRPALQQEFNILRANLLARSGNTEKARSFNQDLLNRDPNFFPAYIHLSNLSRGNESQDTWLREMTEFVKDPAVPKTDKIPLHFAIAKSFDRQGNYKSAMQHYQNANDLNVQVHSYLRAFDKKSFASRINNLITCFDSDFIRRNENASQSSTRPIFIMGMMRSGTTMVEQILTCHSRVAGAGELAHWAYAERNVVDLVRKVIDSRELEIATKRYLEILETVDANSEHVTDKNPANLFALGLIALAFPKARIIYMVRDPLETALSIYVTPTENPPEFGCNRENIVLAIQETLRLKHHWQQVISPEQLHFLRYEDFVLDQEAATRNLLECCNLDWEEACLRPQENRSLVRTPSMFQVRQKMYTESLTRSHRYEPWLGALTQLRDISPA